MQHKPAKIIGYTIGGIILAALIFITGVLTSSSLKKEVPVVASLATAQESRDLTQFWRVWNILQQKYPFEEPSVENKIYGAIDGLAQSYDDPHTSFLEPDNSKMFQDNVEGEFSGVGMEVSMRNDMLTVVAPLKGTPANKAGVQSGDIIAEINGDSTSGLSINEAVKKIRGKKDTEVVLTVIREGTSEPIEISITRDIIDIPIIDHGTVTDEIYKISLYNFNEKASTKLINAFETFQQSDHSKLILDLRGNPGGLLSEAIKIASIFVPKEKRIVKEDFGEKQEPKIYRSKGSALQKPEGFAMVVLVNEGSASASEIVAGAIQDHGISELVGTKTFGKGSVQELIPLPGGSSLKVTIAKWITPKGTSLRDTGLTPDHIVEIKDTAKNAEMDAQIEKAVSVLSEDE